MPILPLDHPEPFAATLGVMLYPGTDENTLNARAFTSQWLAEPIRRLNDAGGKISPNTLLRITMDAGRRLMDLDDRWWEGTATGELFKTLFALFNTKTALATWNNATTIAEFTATRAKASGSRSALWGARSRFLSVAHLWGAWSIREGKFKTISEVGYDGYADLQSFLTEAEILRRWGQTWQPPRAKSKPLLPPNVWHVPKNWEPPTRQPGWPPTGKVPAITLPADLVARLKAAGRPRKHG